MRSRLKAANVPGVDLRTQSFKVRCQFVGPKIYHFVSADGSKEYIGASLNRAAEILGVSKKELEKLKGLKDFDLEGYYTGENSIGVRRHRIDSYTLEAMNSNRTKWIIGEMYMFKKGDEFVFSNDPEYHESYEGKKNEVQKTLQTIDISKIFNPNQSNKPTILADFSSPDDKKKKTPDDTDPSVISSDAIPSIMWTGGVVEPFDTTSTLAASRPISA